MQVRRFRRLCSALCYMPLILSWPCEICTVIITILTDKGRPWGCGVLPTAHSGKSRAGVWTWAISLQHPPIYLPLHCRAPGEAFSEYMGRMVLSFPSGQHTIKQVIKDASSKLSSSNLKIQMYIHVCYIKTWFQEGVHLKRDTFQNGPHLSPKTIL